MVLLNKKGDVEAFDYFKVKLELEDARCEYEWRFSAEKYIEERRESIRLMCKREIYLPKEDKEE